MENYKLNFNKLILLSFIFLFCSKDSTFEGVGSFKEINDNPCCPGYTIMLPTLPMDDSNTNYERVYHFKRIPKIDTKVFVSLIANGIDLQNLDKIRVNVVAINSDSTELLNISSTLSEWNFVKTNEDSGEYSFSYVKQGGPYGFFDAENTGYRNFALSFMLQRFSPNVALGKIRLKLQAGGL